MKRTCTPGPDPPSKRRKRDPVIRKKDENRSVSKGNYLHDHASDDDVNESQEKPFNLSSLSSSDDSGIIKINRGDEKIDGVKQIKDELQVEKKDTKQFL